MGRWDRGRRSRSRSPRNSRNRSRSRSPSSRSSRKRDDRRSRSRSKDRDRERHSRHERRDKNKDRSKDKDKDRKRRSKSKENGAAEAPRPEPSKGPKTIEDIVGGDATLDLDIEEQQKKLDVVMQQRRERIERWREQQRQAQLQQQAEKIEQQLQDPTPASGAEQAKASADQDVASSQQAEASNAPEEKKKEWTLDDEGSESEEDDRMQLDSDEDDRELILPKKHEDEEQDVIEKVQAAPNANAELKQAKNEATEDQPAESAPNTAEEEEDDDEIDPLDAYMMGIQAEVKKLRGKTVKEEEKTDGKRVAVVVGMAKSKEQRQQPKGELLEQNQDAMEYSSEDEATTAEDLAQMNSSLQNSSKQKLKITSITLADISYEPFRKSFYIEVPELASMTADEVEEYRQSLGEGIKVKGKQCPKPIKSWPQAGLSRKVMDTLKRLGYEKPTPIQAQAIPVIMSGRDMIGIAKTGSGKTLAFLLPMFRHILDQRELESGEGPIAIIMTPTRELATQIWSECRKFAKPLGLRCVAVYGGTSISEQIGELKPGAEIVVCTPGRMIDMLNANSGRVTNLKRCTYIVLDEADRMFDMGFEPQVMRVIDGIRPDRQTVMFSATFPRIMEALARRILDKPIEVTVGGRSIVAKEIEQVVHVVSDNDKFLKLLEVLGRHLQEENKSAIVFVDKQESADHLQKELFDFNYMSFALHGGIDQNDRDSIIANFKNGLVSVLVATSVAARGLDVKHCCLVVNYDCPSHYEDYVHRCGRTGRAGNSGHAYTFLAPDQGRQAGDIIKAFELSGRTPPEEVKRLFNTYKCAQELMGKKVKSGGGFSGKGFKFDEEEAAFKDQQKRLQKAALGLQDSDDEDDDEDNLENDILSIMAPKKSVKIVKPAEAAAGVILAAPGTAAAQLPGAQIVPLDDKKEQAHRVAAMLSRSLSAKPSTATGATEAIMRGESIQPLHSNILMAKSVAEQRIQQLNARLNYSRNDIEYDADGEPIRSRPEVGVLGPGDEGFQRYEEELEINDFPQQARWRVTSREALAQISEYSEAGLTVRGTYYGPGQRVPEGERKLYLAIEGINEGAVKKAKSEIIRLIKEELIKLQSSGHQIGRGTSGRYKVL